MTSPPPPTKPQPTKLRDSCNACAVSKLKCSKEKPLCARCAKRGLRCEYFATRRAGRRHDLGARQRQQDDGPVSVNNGSDDGSDARSSVHVAVSAAPDATSHAHFTPSWDVHMCDDPHDSTHPALSDALSSPNAHTLAGDDSAPWQLLTAVMPDANDLFASFPLGEMPSQLHVFNMNPVGEEPKKMPNSDSDGLDFGPFTGFELAPDTGTLVLDETGFDAVDHFSLSTAWDSPSSPSLSPRSSLLSSASSSLTTASVFTTATTQRTSVSNSNHSNSPPGSHGFAPTILASTTAPWPASGCCLFRALELLTNLFPSSAACTCQAPSALSSGTEIPIVSTALHDDKGPTMQHVVAKNKQTLEAIQIILECPCSGADNSYLLAVISLVILKVLGWYKAAVQDLPVAMWTQQHRSSVGNPRKGEAGNDPIPTRERRRRPACHAERVLQTPAVIDGYRLDGDDQARMAAQLVLSELHRVQRLVNVLGSRLKQGPEGGGRNLGSGNPGDTPVFSPAWFGQLETDLRKRVRSLSLEIVDMLRQ